MPLPARQFRDLIIILIVALYGCSNNHKPNAKKQVPLQVDSVGNVQYPESVLLSYLDSIGHLSVQPLADEAAHGADSVFRNSITPLNRELSAGDFYLLRRAALAGMIKPNIAKIIFGGLTVDSNCTAKSLIDSVKKGFIYLKYFPFDKDANKFDEFAVRLSNQRHCGSAKFYFFKGRKLIASQPDGSWDDDDISYFKNVDGEAIVYHRVNFDEGSGIWWYNNFFYKYESEKLIPVLNELENGNAQGFLEFRTLWLESTIQKTNPLTIKMVYYNQFSNVSGSSDSSYFINDSTIVRYKWDKHTKTLEGQYDRSKISRAQILSYYLGNNDYLFIATHYQLFKQHLLNKAERPNILGYLNTTKNAFNRVNKDQQKLKK